MRDNGIVIPSKDEQALYEAMKRMLTDTEMRQRMAGNSRRMIADRFDQNYVRQCLLDFYDEIMA
jgi:glycosyltransferase involved in cell wall biosynthesis